MDERIVDVVAKDGWLEALRKVRSELVVEWRKKSAREKSQGKSQGKSQKRKKKDDSCDILSRMSTDQLALFYAGREIGEKRKRARESQGKSNDG